MPLTASNMSSAGYYHIRTADGKKVGWVLAEKIGLQKKDVPDSSEEVQVKVEKITKEKFHFVGLGGLNFFNLKGMLLSYSSSLAAYDAGIEATWFFLNRFGLTFHGEYIYQSAVLNNSLDQRQYRLVLNSIPLMGGIKWVVFKGKKLFLGWSFLGGVGYNTVSSNDPNYALALTGYPRLFSTRVDINYRFSKRFFALLHGGYLYQNPLLYSLSTSGSNMGLVLNPQFNLNLSGFFGGIGLGLSF